METREKVLQIVKNILVGPNPLPGYTQENGEEILFFDSPLKTYVTGILFPQSRIWEGVADEADDESVSEEDFDDIPYAAEEKKEIESAADNVAEPTIEAETSKINNYRQSAMGMTLCVPICADNIKIVASVGAYTEQMSAVPLETKNSEGERVVVMSDNRRRCYYRRQIDSVLEVKRDALPTAEKRHKQYDITDCNGTKLDGLCVAITYRLNDRKCGCTIYTVTLLNTRQSFERNVDPTDCWYQCAFDVCCDKGFSPLPDKFCAEIEDDDYRLNALLYRDIKTYAIGHGCSATWNDDLIPKSISANVLPEYEVKSIVPTTSAAALSMKLYSQDKKATLADIQLLCNEYGAWIEKEENGIETIEEEALREVARKQIELCKKCLRRMEEGKSLLETNDVVLKAFQLANKAMLMQQLHYRLPLTEYEKYDTKTLEFVLKNKIRLPDPEDETTWYDNGKVTYGKWRPFQLAFILINLNSIWDKDSPERKTVDLIWFPTGGGKTEAYLGLTAVAVFMRRLKNPDDFGTTVIMRYTLRLLTAQQYERAASLICSMEKIRSENEKLLGSARITIGLWVGNSLTDNNSDDVIARIKKIRKGSTRENVSVILKCPWCGASMETLKTETAAQTPGYEISTDKKHVVFRCGNKDCDFADENFTLPLVLFDDEIYANPPTLLFGTVDKFAMLPYRPEAKALFGGDGERTPPELIIQDELHLITGPLGSAVGLYETLVDELCFRNGNHPKVVASTATISHAKQQCNALYGCGEDDVFQFPVQGTTYKDCFFAKEDREKTGRKYVGLYGSAASSSATASIYTFAAFLYAAKAIDVENEEDRDPYWTNLAYFGSMRELGQAVTWFIADIKEHLEVIYRNRLEAGFDDTRRRHIYENGLAELTSRMPNSEIPKLLKRLEVKYDGEKNKALDVCMATNMISVGVDIPRLGLMTVTGQPKSTSEYIQATSRVGRSASAPGLVFVIYNTSKPRDKSHYEKFQSLHSKLYCNVEPTSVTPFSRPLRERALPAVFAALHRFFVAKASRNDATRVPTSDEFDQIVGVISSRAEGIDKEEIPDIKRQLKKLLDEWTSWKPEIYSSFALSENAPLLCQSGTIKPQSWENRGWDSPTSMRNVDRQCGLDCSKSLSVDEEEN